MTRRVFFSFHYERDVWRAGQIRNSWVTKPNRETAGFWDSVEWEKVKSEGDVSIHRWIDKQLEGTSVTVVLIGAETNDRPYINYEIQQSYNKKNGLLAIYINNIKNQFGNTDTKGHNPFDYWYVPNNNNQKIYFNKFYCTYDWIMNSGYENLGVWVERAAKDANK